MWRVGSIQEAVASESEYKNQGMGSSCVQEKAVRWGWKCEVVINFLITLYRMSSVNGDRAFQLQFIFPSISSQQPFQDTGQNAPTWGKGRQVASVKTQHLLLLLPTAAQGQHYSTTTMSPCSNIGEAWEKPFLPNTAQAPHTAAWSNGLMGCRLLIPDPSNRNHLNLTMLRLKCKTHFFSNDFSQD